MSCDPRLREEVVGLARRLISIESHRDAPGREGPIGRFLVEWFRDRGIDAWTESVEGDRSNVIARVPGNGGPSLFLNGHLDTVPAGDMRDAFAPRVEDGVLWGRGACDMKGAIAAMACAIVAIAGDEERLGARGAEASLRSVGEPAKGRCRAAVRGLAGLHGELLFVGTVDEESGSLGVKALVDSGIRADYAVIGEPTSLRVAIAHKGACFIRISLVGRSAHGSCPERGVNAATHAARIVTTIEDELRPVLAARTYPHLGLSTVSVGRICGGTQPNIVAERCEIEIDRRYLPGEPSPVAEIREIVAGVCRRVEGLQFEVAEMPMTSAVPHVPLGTSPRSRLARAARSTCRQLGLADDPVGVTYWSDGGHLAASGIETIVLGPGNIVDAHGPGDRVAISELEAAVALYSRIATSVLSSET